MIRALRNKVKGGRNKMKRITKVTAFLLALVLALGCSMTAFASSAENTSTELPIETVAETSAELPTETVTEASAESETERPTESETELATETITEPAVVTAAITEQSLYEQLMACETLEEMLDLLDKQEAEPSTPLTDGEREDFEGYLNRSLENGEWTEAYAEEKVASIIGILEGSESEATAYAGPGSGGNQGGGGSQNTQNYVVYVYVCCVYNGERLISDECLELLGLDPDTIDQYGYIPVGQITNIDSLINAKGGLNRISASTSLLTSADDWATLLSALGDLDTSTLTSSDNSHVLRKDFTANKNNSVAQYIGQARQDINASGSSGKSQLSLQYKGTDTASKYSCGFSNEGDYYAVFHLDLFFNTKKITFVTGNNGINTGNLPDGTTVDTRSYITGSAIQNPKDFNSSIPGGYYWDGKYYKDADFTEEWDGIGTPLNEDTTVYIKLIEYGKCLVEYKVAQGEGTVSISSETFYATGTGTPNQPDGSTAAPAAGYVFEGWYADEDCSSKVSDSAAFVPTPPADGWQENVTYTYYAKFVPASRTFTITKQVTGNMGDTSKLFAFTVTSDKAMTAVSSTDTTSSNDTIAADGLSASLQLYDDETVTITVPVGATITITEINADGYETAYAVGDDQTDGNVYTINGITSDTDITVTNTKDATIDTGILLDAIPYVLILAVVAAGAVFLLARRRRNGEE